MIHRTNPLQALHSLTTTSVISRLQIPLTSRYRALHTLEFIESRNNPISTLSLTMKAERAIKKERKIYDFKYSLLNHIQAALTRAGKVRRYL